jgi:hypothetical protein
MMHADVERRLSDCQLGNEFRDAAHQHCRR